MAREQFEAADAEPDAQGERLELLAVVRGLEALEQPSRVTLVTPSKYVNRGLTYGLEEWRANDWQWEHFGEMVPVKNRDLWQRVDRALAYPPVGMPHLAIRFAALRRPRRGASRDHPGRSRRALVAVAAERAAATPLGGLRAVVGRAASLAGAVDGPMRHAAVAAALAAIGQNSGVSRLGRPNAGILPLDATAQIRQSLRYHR